MFEKLFSNTPGKHWNGHCYEWGQTGMAGLSIAVDLAKSQLGGKELLWETKRAGRNCARRSPYYSNWLSTGSIAEGGHLIALRPGSKLAPKLEHLVTRKSPKIVVSLGVQASLKNFTSGESY